MTSTTKNRTSSDYWRGYRAARIYALLSAIERYEQHRIDMDDSQESEAYLTGFHAGVRSLRKELTALLDKDSGFK